MLPKRRSQGPLGPVGLPWKIGTSGSLPIFRVMMIWLIGAIGAPIYTSKIYAPQTRISHAPLGPVVLPWKIGTSGSLHVPCNVISVGC
jgi:hypothetical protein